MIRHFDKHLSKYLLLPSHQKALMGMTIDRIGILIHESDLTVIVQSYRQVFPPHSPPPLLPCPALPYPATRDNCHLPEEHDLHVPPGVPE